MKQILIDVEYLEKMIKNMVEGYENSAEECIQERDNEEQANIYFGKIEALNDVLRQIKMIYEDEK